MVGLNGSLSIASRALAAQYAGLAVANNNIANVNTPGYSRQIVNLSSVASVQGGTSVSEGVSYDGYTSVRDEVLTHSIRSKTSDQGSLSAQQTILNQVNSTFGTAENGVGSAMSALFSQLSALSVTPTDPSARQSVLTSAASLVNSFHQEAGILSSARDAANQQVITTVAKINQLSSSLADLNAQLASLDASSSNAGSLQDTRDQITNELAKLTSVSSTQTGGSPSLTTSGGSPLVLGTHAYALQLSTAPDGTAHVFDAQGKDITSSLTGGELGGALQVRDSTVPSLATQLDTLANQFASAMNSAQAAGYDANGAPGAAMFSVPTSISGSAANITLSLNSGSALAISSDGSPASSGNVSSFLVVQSGKLPSGGSPIDAYAAIISSIGTAGQQVSSGLAASTAALSQLNAQRDSTSGVSIDEESTNLIRYQQAYTAAAKVISTINTLYSVVMNMAGGS